MMPERKIIIGAIIMPFGGRKPTNIPNRRIWLKSKTINIREGECDRQVRMARFTCKDVGIPTCDARQLDHVMAQGWVSVLGADWNLRTLKGNYELNIMAVKNGDECFDKV